MFWIKKKKIIVDAFTDNEIVASLPVQPCSRNLPIWYKSLKPTLDVNDNGHNLKVPTFKKCDGISDLFKKSFTLSMWADLSIAVDSQGRYNWKYPSSEYNFGVEHHPDIVMGNAFSPYVHTKIVSPWLFREKTGINFYQTEAFYSDQFNNNVLIPPGVLNYKYQQHTHINMFLARENSYFFNAGQPMVYLIPMTDHRVEIKTQIVSSEEYKKMKKYSSPNKFVGTYKTLKYKGVCPITGRS